MFVPEDSKPCRRDSNCVLVDKNCCSCSHGGHSIAVHKSQKRKIVKQLKNRCKEVVKRCLAVYICDKWEARCVNSKCEVVEKKVLGKIKK